MSGGSGLVTHLPVITQPRSTARISHSMFLIVDAAEGNGRQDAGGTSSPVGALAAVRPLPAVPPP